jgi:hypothetical protein
VTGGIGGIGGFGFARGAKSGGLLSRDGLFKLAGYAAVAYVGACFLVLGLGGWWCWGGRGCVCVCVCLGVGVCVCVHVIFWSRVLGGI